MYPKVFIQGRLAHLKNRRVAVLRSLRSYGHNMPAQHKSYKIRYMLPAIENAIVTIENNPKEYGICKECGKLIPKKRLELLPEADHCTNCQSQQEGMVHYG